MTLALLVSIVWTHPIAADGPTTVTYTYDDAGRIVSAAYDSGATIAYTYDAMGNLLSRKITIRRNIYLPLVLRNK